MWEKIFKGSQMSLFLAINAKGEKVLAQSKRTAPSSNFKRSFQIDI
jgi:hypothetical protein